MSPARPDLSARAAAWILAVLVVAGFALRTWRLRAFLPDVFHSDAAQVDHATDLLTNGRFVNGAPYPPAHVFAYALADGVAYLTGRAAGCWTGWEEFTARLAADGDPSLRHAIARLYTAIAGALLPLAVYALARVRLGRRASLLAAAMAAFSPAHVIYSHQARIHVPGIVLLTLAAVPVARLASVVNVRRALLAGAACGAAASVIQLGHLLAAAGAVLLVGRLRRRCAWPLAAFGAAHAAVLGGVALALDSTGVVLTLPGASDLLGVPRSTIGDFTLRRFAELFPEFVELWIFAEPMAAAGVMILTWSCVKPSAERSGRRTTAAVYGLYPAILFVALGTTYSAPRYSLSATPFLAILAAEGILTIRGAGARRILAGLAVAVPLSLSLRYDALLDAPDTRVLLRAIVRQVHASDPSVVVEANLLSSEHAEGGRIRVFPPDWDYRIWSPGRRETPLETLTKMDAGVYIQNRMRWRAQSVTAEELRGLGYRLSRVVEGSPPGESSLPDAPDRIAIDLWRSERCGPTLELWTRGERSRSAVDAALDPR